MDLYYCALSAPCRSVLLIARALGITLNKMRVDIFEGEQNSPEFLKLNFQHCIPTLADGDFILWESRAICTYLASNYGKDDSLYPVCPTKRALVDQLLYFDMGAFGECVCPVLLSGGSIDHEEIDKVQEVLGYLNKFLDGHDYAAGNSITVADYCLVASVSTVIASGFDTTEHPNVVAWLKRCRTQMPGYDTENQAGAEVFGALVKAKIGL